MHPENLPVRLLRGTAKLVVVWGAVFWSIASISAQENRAQANDKEPRRPNIVLVLADDQGWGDLGLHGNANIRTPNLDALARAGARFDRFYVSPLCAPTRASLLTGRYHLRTGVTGVTRGEERMNLDEVTFAEVFQAAGYATGAFGKWHNGSQYPYHPNGRGFEEFYGFCCGHWSNYFGPPLERNGEDIRGNGYIADDFTEHALDFIQASVERKRPFVCYLAYNTPHSPFQVPDEYYDRVRRRGLSMLHDGPGQEKTEETICALAMCENIDDNVGRLLARLDRLGVAGDTIVLYMSDNGPATWRWNGGMKGKKGSIDEGGVRSPFFVRWPGHISPGRKIAQIAGHIDVMPTLLELCGLDSAQSPRRPKPFDGRSLKPLLLGERVDWPERKIFSAQGKPTSVRTERYRADFQGLYDMQADPGQRENLAAKQPELHRELLAAMNGWRQEVEDRNPPKRPYPVGHERAALTWLSAQDCEFHGPGLRFSARPPNSSWLTNWTDASAYPSWDVEVLTPGTYEVFLNYACAAEAVGTELELLFEGRSVTAAVAEAFDPPLLPSPDRSQRVESYEKPFKRWKLGETGPQAIELRRIELRRIK